MFQVLRSHVWQATGMLNRDNMGHLLSLGQLSWAVLISAGGRAEKTGVVAGSLVDLAWKDKKVIFWLFLFLSGIGNKVIK